MVRTSRFVACAVALLMFAAQTASAAVVATVDRSTVEKNESFTLQLNVDSAADMTPDLSVLEEDFNVAQSSRLSNTSIVNGQISRSMTWTIVLMPKRAGALTIPPIPVGNDRSNPITMNVTEPQVAPPGEADVFITAEVDFAETYVQAQVIYTVKIYRAVATRQPSLRDPQFSGAEVLVELANDERNYEAILNGRAYNVVERSLAIFPIEDGTVSISPTLFEARVLKDGRITGRKVFESEALQINVNPIPAPPAEFPDAAWLPAKDLTLTDAWSRDPAELKAGEPISRNITVSALGQLETQLPAIALPEVDGVNLYADQPTLQRRSEDGGIRGMRTDQYALIGVAGGEVSLTEVVLPWFDIVAGEWRTARLAEQRVQILPGEEAPVIETAEPAPDVAENAEPTIVHSAFWRRVAEILAGIWVVTLIAWWWSSRPPREQREPPTVPVHKQQARLLKEARKQAQAGDLAGVRQSLLSWAQVQWPNDPPRSIAGLADRVKDPLASELRALSASSYGTSASNIDCEALAKALRRVDERRPESTEESGDVLPPLMPG